MSIVYSVIVTFNRKLLLQRCLTAMLAQTRKPDRIVVVDNASTDGTRAMLSESGWLGRDGVELLVLAENTGGAGGFAAGIDYSVKSGADWVWIMDDDAVPHPNALECLLDVALESAHLYGSVAVSGQCLSWPMTPFGLSHEAVVHNALQLPDLLDVRFIPFIGLLISRNMVEKIGLPDAGFFLAADDVEYCLRARRCGAKVILVARSQVEHPESQSYRIRLPFRTLVSLRLAPWKRYYDVRNRLLVAHRHFGLRVYFQTLPASFVRLFVTLIREPERLLQCRAFVGGIVDGLLQRKGRRHEFWGL